jgi:ribonucleoside-diphosphate reductase alpha chain
MAPAAGVINLAQLVSAPFTDARLDVTQLRQLVRVRSACSTIRWMCHALRWMHKDSRRKISVIRLVLQVWRMQFNAGCAVWVIKGGVLLGSWMQTIQNAAYGASALAKERGAFPLYDADKHLASRGIQALDQDIRTLVERHGLRNGTLTTIAPTGTTSMFAGNVSSGIEPIFSTSFTRDHHAQR